MTSLMTLRTLPKLTAEVAIANVLGMLPAVMTYLQRGSIDPTHPVTLAVEALRAALIGYDATNTSIAPYATALPCGFREIAQPVIAHVAYSPEGRDVNEINPSTAQKSSTGHDITDADERFLAELRKNVRMSKKDCRAFIGLTAGDTLARLEGSGRIVCVGKAGRGAGYKAGQPQGWDSVEGGGENAPEVYGPHIDERKLQARNVAESRMAKNKPVVPITEPELVKELVKDESVRKEIKAEIVKTLEALRAEAKACGVKGSHLFKDIGKLQTAIADKRKAMPLVQPPTLVPITKEEATAALPKEVVKPTVDVRPTMADAVARVKELQSPTGMTTDEILNELMARIDESKSARAKGMMRELKSLRAAGAF